MACFKIHTKALKNECETMSQEAKTLSKYVEEIDKIAAQISLDHSTTSVKKTLQTISKNVRTESVSLSLFSSKLNEVIVQYEVAEKSIAKDSVVQNTMDDKSGDEGTNGSEDETESEDNETEEMIWTILGFIPGLNCVADIRQIIKDIKRVCAKHEDGSLPTFSEIMGILMDFAFLAMDFVSAVSLAKNIAKSIKAAKVASTAAKEATQKAAKAAEKAEKAADQARRAASKSKAARKSAETAKKAERAERAKEAAEVAKKEAETAKRAAAFANGEAAKNAVTETAKQTVENVIDEYGETPTNGYVPNAIKREARDQMIG
ncbi:MAG: hypothetical protein K2L07_10970 [Lachnospiraceae bacterium]|nr:hypothetical protein [Lachnospiraceae bacterium]